MLSVIIPAHNEQDNAPACASAVSRLLDSYDIDYELIFVDDGSTDRTWLRLTQLARSDERIKAICLSRNFGKESAIFAGLENAGGDVCAVMDCDLQHPPETLVEMYKVWRDGDGVDIVEAKKRSRGTESGGYRFFAKLFYRIMNRVSGLDMSDASDFKLLDRRAVDALLRMPERLTFFRAMSSWVGFNTETVYFDVAERRSGKSDFDTKTSLKYAVTSITSFTSAPMQLVTVLGVITFIIAMIFGINTLYNKLTGNSEAGFPTVILLQLITSAIIMFSLGIIGYYLSKIYEEIKQRPRYIISEKLNLDRRD
ncbi:Glycosyl transferase family 2 [Ruminococcus sp. YE71]|nr:glycosyltransferase family 2 protein [Ruminococcus sp. YE71]SDA14521.1 Glycosyl transferase family 2 [Ruminococcus sp. YE78]SFW21148.1 Glycosyl transferase family 2 [Ruminococcus sp. YE71]